MAQRHFSAFKLAVISGQYGSPFPASATAENEKEKSVCKSQYLEIKSNYSVHIYSTFDFVQAIVC